MESTSENNKLDQDEPKPVKKGAASHPILTISPIRTSSGSSEQLSQSVVYYEEETSQ
jgi:hypothetical protein